MISRLRVADQLPVQAVEQLVALLLVQLEVAGRMERDRADPAAVAPDPQRDLLRHRPARHEHRRLLAEQLGDLLLEALDPLARAVRIRPLALVRRVGERRQGVASGWAAVPRVQEALGTLGGGSKALFVHPAETIEIHISYSSVMVSGDLLREARLRAGLTQDELAERAGTARSQISRYERGDVLPSLETLRRLIRPVVSSSASGSSTPTSRSTTRR